METAIFRRKLPVGAASLFENCSSDYHQALCDFGVTELMAQLSNFTDADFDAQRISLDETGIESLAAILIQRLSISLKGSQITSSLNILRHGDVQAIADLPALELKPLPTHFTLPEDFPQLATNTLFLDGEPVRWIPLLGNTETTTGIVIGRFYAYARHQQKWTWKYLVWLKDSPEPVVADTAWEDDLEPLERKAVP